MCKLLANYRKSEKSKKAVKKSTDLEYIGEVPQIVIKNIQPIATEETWQEEPETFEEETKS